MHFKDQIGNELKLRKSPERIISLVPSITEFLFDIGLDNRIVGVTKFCEHPKNARSTKTIVGGTKTIHLDKIHLLKPDLIIAAKEENTKEKILPLIAQYPTYVSNIKTLEDAFKMMEDIGKITNSGLSVEKMINEIKALKSTINKDQKYTVCYLIWKKPYMTVGGDTFINHMLSEGGFENCMKNTKRYPEISIDKLQEMSPNIVMLSSEPYPFKNKDIEELKSALPHSEICLVDGQTYSWYGSRLIHAFEDISSFRKSLQKI